MNGLGFKNLLTSICEERHKFMKKENLYGILSGVFCASLIISNILAFKTFMIGSVVLPTAVILFPIVYITNDILTEIYGFERTKSVIITGFAMNIIAVIGYDIAISLPEPPFFEGQEAFRTVLGNSFRVLVASMVSYIIGSLVNAKVMEHLKHGRSLFSRCVLSTFAGEGLDALIFITIAFLGTIPMASLAVMIVCQALFKTVYEIICYPVTRVLILKTRNLN
jgi:uncharacterized integral membrane protein (TIGR00697 family)